MSAQKDLTIEMIVAALFESDEWEAKLNAAIDARVSDLASEAMGIAGRDRYNPTDLSEAAEEAMCCLRKAADGEEP